ncbi:uncharacterized protein Bfra_008144 [Botrytis fragariae]|uniref:Uncharacterized protein n=1 Tax=Botrytis fragariae TaxID=1964551 RepID=A0A8H6EHX4_9HELO|nr:uncharacterized protein Bfra_008144 [Botrytis fragariae]KAF5872868.1 hypothetical protein Bfra_008144 [Botrytis fragariae]
MYDVEEGRGNELRCNRTLFFDSSQGQGQGQKEATRGASLRHMIEKIKFIHRSKISGLKKKPQEGQAAGLKEEEQEEAEDYNG